MYLQLFNLLYIFPKIYLNCHLDKSVEAVNVQDPSN